MGESMKRVFLIAATIGLALAMAAQPGWAARKSHTPCTSKSSAASSAEAEQAIRYMTDLMVASSACRNTVYAEFALRNRLTIIRYQNAMIRQLRGKSAFDKWNTSLANQIALIQAAIPPGQFCQQKAPLMKQAAALDPRGFQAIAEAQAASSAAAKTKCGR